MTDDDGTMKQTDAEPAGLYRKITRYQGSIAEHDSYEIVGAAEVPAFANSLVRDMITGLVRAAELLEVRELDCGHVEIWDDAARGALQEARDHGWCVSLKPIPKPRTPVDHHEGSFGEELENLINRHCIENGSNTPDYLLASYLQSCLDNWNKHVLLRDKWYGVSLKPGGNFEETEVCPAAPAVPE